MSSPNGFNLGLLLQRFRQQDYTGLPRYQVFSYVLNPAMDLIQQDPRRPYGVIIPVGSFEKYKQAEKCRDRIAITTKAATFVCDVGDYKPLSLTPDENTMTIPYTDQTTVEQIQTDINHKQKQIIEQRQRKNEEIKLRSDPNTTEYFVQQLYQYTVRASRLEEAEKLIQTTTEQMHQYKENVHQFILKHPDVLSEWETKCRQRYEENREMSIYELANTALKKFLAELAEAGEFVGPASSNQDSLVGQLDMDPTILSEYDNHVLSLKKQDDDGSDEDFTILVTPEQMARQQLEELTKSAASSSSLPGQDTTVHQKWSQVLQGEKSLTEFKEEVTTKTPSEEEGWITVGRRNASKKKGKPTPRIQNYRGRRGRGKK